MRVQNADEILVKMASLLEDAGVLEKTASESTPELNAIAGSIMSIADQLDMAGADVAATRLDAALAKMAEVGCMPEVKAAGEPAGDKDVVMKAAATTLIRIADKLDAMELDAAADIDRALMALAEVCMCSCKKCAMAQAGTDHCHDEKAGCTVGSGEEKPVPA